MKPVKREWILLKGVQFLSRGGPYGPLLNKLMTNKPYRLDPTHSPTDKKFLDTCMKTIVSPEPPICMFSKDFDVQANQNYITE